MSPKQYERTFPWLTKTLAELDAPVLDLASPLKRFTAQLHTLNYFFWSTEIAYANLLRAYAEYQDGAQPAPTVLENCSASAFKPRGGTKKPHYTASMGSLIVQTRWNYDRLARQVIVEGHSALERLVAARATPIVGEKIAQGPFHKLWRALAKGGYHLDPVTTYRTQLYREIRNNVVHDFSTIHSFPNPALINRTWKVRAVAKTWSTDPAWPAVLTKVFNEIMWTTRQAADSSDLPQLFFGSPKESVGEKDTDE